MDSNRRFLIINIHVNCIWYTIDFMFNSVLSAIDLLLGYSDLKSASLNKVVACLLENGALPRHGLSFQLVTLDAVQGNAHYLVLTFNSYTWTNY